MADVITHAQTHVHLLTFCGLFGMFHGVNLVMCSEKAMDMMISIMTDDGLAQAINEGLGSAVDTKGRAILSPQCPSCGCPVEITWVHGHGQCAHCHTNVMPCCVGAVFENF